jgi:succinate-semialdehyde dehydrogenase/glutarate-semialdehyde dehydrogenase
VSIQQREKYSRPYPEQIDDIERAKRVASRMETGVVFINYPDVSLPELPFGGVKRSGYGKELSSLGIEEFVNSKLIFVPNGHFGG